MHNLYKRILQDMCLSLSGSHERCAETGGAKLVPGSGGIVLASGGVKVGHLFSFCDECRRVGDLYRGPLSEGSPGLF